jgi:iron(III) transport system substrate-binding protein
MINRVAAQAVMTSVISLLLVSCEPSTTPTNGRVLAEPVVVYATYGETYLPEFFEAFTESSGIRVVVRNADEVVDDVIANRGSPPADVLLTDDVTGIWRAADVGALRPVALSESQDLLPEWLRDPDGYWVAVGFRTSVLAYDSRVSGFEAPTSYKDLADERYRGQLCLSSSSGSANRTVIAMLISEMGVRPAEIVVRGWMANLAMPVYDSEDELLEALRSTYCQMGIVSSNNIALTEDDAEAIVPRAAFPVLFANIEGAGVARHARNPDAAAALIEWMLSAEAQSSHSQHTFSYSVLESDAHADVSRENVSTTGWQDSDAARLAQRAGYR